MDKSVEVESLTDEERKFIELYRQLDDTKKRRNKTKDSFRRFGIVFIFCEIAVYLF